MKLKWVVQNNLGQSSDVHRFVEFLEVQGVHWEHIPIIPFDNSPITGVDKEGITVFYGSTGMVRRVYETGGWAPGVWFDPTRFGFHALLDGFGQDLLNADSEVVSVGELLQRSYGKEKLFFSRPAQDSKAFTGGLFYFSEIQEWSQCFESPTNMIKPETLVQISEPKVIERELRSFVVNGKISTSSYYAHGKRMHEVEPEDVEFAQEMANKYQPAAVFTLDTCRLEDGTRRVVETNCFNSSGFYNSDIYKLIQDINSFLLNESC